MKNKFSIWFFLKKFYVILFLSILLSVSASLAGFGLLFLSGWFLAATAIAGLGGIVAQNMFNIFTPAAGVRFFALTRIITRYLERLASHDAALKVTGNLRLWSFKQLFPRSVEIAIKTRSSDLLSRFVKDTEITGEAPINIFLPRINIFICTFFIIILFYIFNHKTALTLISSFLICGITLPYLVKKITLPLIKKEITNTDQLSQSILETMQGMSDIILCNSKNRKLKEIHSLQKNINHLNIKRAFFVNIIKQLYQFILIINIIGIIYITSEACWQNQLSLADIPMLVLGVFSYFEIISPIIDVQLSQNRYKETLKRMETLLQLPITVKVPSPLAIPDGNSLSFNSINLNFNNYSILKDLSFSIKNSEHIAITGPSGSGKTTIIRLIMHLINPNSGEIKLNSINLNHFLTHDLSKKIGVLQQSPHLFEGSLYRNFLIANPQINEKDIWEALKIVNLYKEINEMPEKLNTLCGENGIRLSGGQLKRFAISQVILRKPDILILDEPTENLPPEMGKNIIKNIIEYLPKTAIICITHRPEPLSFMDHVYHLEKGHLTHT